MADTKYPENEKGAVETDIASSAAHSTKLPRPAGWRYKRFKLGPISFPWYASPTAQILIVAVVCFLCPGMFNALGGMGGGGQVQAQTADTANLCLYSVFAGVGFLAGSITNVIGIRTAIGFGGLGYSVYIASFLSYNHNQNNGFIIFAGIMLGLCAGLLWTAQGTIMMSYPPEEKKGRYISWFWIIFNFGAVIGSLIPLGQNIHVQEQRSVTDGTYIGFLVLTFLGALAALTLVNAKDVVRSDGSRVITMKSTTWKEELFGLYETFKIDPAILLLFPMFFASNWFYTYQFNAFNAARFDVRTRALNSLLYWAMQIFGALLFGYLLDYKGVRRSIKARIAWGVLFSITMIVWGGGYAWQKKYERYRGNDPTQQATVFEGPEVYDWNTSGYVGPMFLYMFYGFYDAAWQTCVYWFMGAMTNNGRRLANYAGFYKGIQSVGAAVAFDLDRVKLSFMKEFASNWGLLGGSLIVALPMIFLRIRDHVSIEEDLKFSDETYEEVAPKVAPGEELRHGSEVVGLEARPEV